MATWAAWLSDLLPQLPGCPAPLVEHELRRAAQYFFGKSRAWRITLAPVMVYAGTDVIEPDVPDGVDLVRVEQVWINGPEIVATTADALSDAFTSGWVDQSGAPSHFFQETPGEIRLFPLPEADISLVARVAVQPSDAATGVPDDLFRKYRIALASGAKARLMMYPNKPWSNPDYGMKHEADFEAEIAKVTYDAQVSFGTARISSKPRWC